MAEYEDIIRTKTLQIISLKKENEALKQIIEKSNIKPSNLSPEAQEIAREAKQVIG